MKLLNVACGARYHEDWINIDFHAPSNDVLKVNLLNGLPFEDDYVDCVYSSHFLEHLSIEDSDFILKEMRRVLKKDGVLRLVVPDLENICREYLDILNPKEKTIDDKKYEWITIELLDQLTRNVTGGRMQKMFDNIFESKDQFLADYVFKRTGDKLLVREKRRNSHALNIDKVKNKLFYIYINLISLLVPKSIRSNIFNRTSMGEKHIWMYDRYSLSKKLEKAGFSNIKIQSHNMSQIESFNSYNLDSYDTGEPYKGEHSIFIEANK